MKIAFWSNVRGHSGVTSNLACISVLSALSCPNERTIVFEKHLLSSAVCRMCKRAHVLPDRKRSGEGSSISGKRGRTF